MKNGLLYIACLLLVSASAQAWDAVNVNFNGSSETKGGAAFGSGTTMAWNSYATGSGTMSNLFDSGGTTTTVSINPNTTRSYSTSTFFSSLTYGQNIMNGYLFVLNNTVNMTIGGLTSGAKYDLYLYGHGDQENQNTRFTVNGVSRSSTINVSGLTTLTENAHYVIYRGIAANTSGQITVNWGNTSGYGAINGVQIVRGNLSATASLPVPSNGAYTTSSPMTLSWTNPAPLVGGNSITCTVYLGTTSTRMSMDGKTLAANASSVSINASNFPTFGSLPRGTDYYWIVDCVDSSPGANPTDGQGEPWMFHNHLANWDGYGGQATGGAGGTTVTVSTAAALLDYATRTGSYIIRISGTVDLGPNGSVSVKSDKTIEGVDINSTVLGTIQIYTGINNVIVRNLNISSRHNDGITIWGSTNVFITHCNIYDCNDGSIDATQGANNITISWCRFSYRNPSSPNHRFVNLVVGPSITFHHNWYDYGCHQRMPMTYDNVVHMYNNYFSCTGAMYCTGAGNGSRILSENNYYQRVDDPLGISPGSTGLIQSIGNIYDQCTGNQYVGGTTLFTPPYVYATDAAMDVPAIVMASAGNRLYGDFDGDNDVDAADLERFARSWLSNTRLAFYLDLSGDGTVSFSEFSRFAANWLVTYQ